MKKVVKFGGSSLSSAEQFKKVAAIIKADPDRKFIVPSAPGKRFDGDAKVTDMLYTCYEAADADEDFSEQLAAIKARYDEIVAGLDLNYSLDDEFDEINKNFKNKVGVDYAASRGEFLNGLILAEYLGFEFIDPKNYIIFDEDGLYEGEHSNRRLRKKIEKCENGVIPGFYGAYSNGVIKTFSRGGSDVTGSIVARALKADLYENWTDVSGFLITDPHIVKNPEPVDMITYRELRELSYMGASVLHEDAIFPVRKAGIPINIKNTNRPDDPGTLIVATTSKKSKYVVTGIAGKKNFVAIRVDKEKMNSEIGFCRKVLSVFEDNCISIEHMPSGIDTMCILVQQDAFQEHEQVILSGIRRAVNPDNITIDTDLALLAVVGRGMIYAHGTAARLFTGLAEQSINCRMIDQGSSELNIIVGIKNDDLEKAIKTIYKTFIH